MSAAQHCQAASKQGTPTSLGELREEEVGQVTDARLGIHEAQRDGRAVAAHLHHVVQDEVGEDHQRCLADQWTLFDTGNEG